MFTTILNVVIIAAGCFVAHWISSDYDDYRAYFESQYENNRK